MTNRGLLAFYSMKSPAKLNHLRSLIATSFTRCLGKNKVDTMHRIARYFHVDLARCSIIERAEPFPVATLYNQRLVLQKDRGVEYLDGLRPSGVMRAAVDLALVEPHPEVTPPAQPPARAPSHRRCPALQRPAQPVATTASEGDPLVQRANCLETTLWE
ncbi:unnamed protein product [Linum trigynum]|uniref:Uncharacterized protein n=1 Tax=Linum trigynum TaxID=586398 RepID=A0AAV2G9I7_9ROSI